jgi:hypothetical protein
MSGGAWPAALAAHGRNRFEQRDELGDVVAVAVVETAATRCRWSR